MLQISDETTRWTKTSKEAVIIPENMSPIVLNQNKFWELFPSAYESMVERGEVFRRITNLQVPKTAFQLYVSVWEPHLRKKLPKAPTGVIKNIFTQNWRSVPLREREMVKLKVNCMKDAYKESSAQPSPNETTEMIELSETERIQQTNLNSNNENIDNMFRGYLRDTLTPDSMNAKMFPEPPYCTFPDLNQTTNEDFATSLNSIANEKIESTADFMTDDPLVEHTEQNRQMNIPNQKCYSSLSSPNTSSRIQFTANCATPIAFPPTPLTIPIESKIDNTENDYSPPSIESVEREEHANAMKRITVLCHCCGAVLLPQNLNITHSVLSFPTLNQQPTQCDQSYSREPLATPMTPMTPVDRLALTPLNTASPLMNKNYAINHRNERIQTPQNIHRMGDIQIKARSSSPYEYHPVMNDRFENNESALHHNNTQLSRDRPQFRLPSLTGMNLTQPNLTPLNQPSPFSEGNDDQQARLMGKEYALQRLMSQLANSMPSNVQRTQSVNPYQQHQGMGNMCVFCNEPVAQGVRVPCARCRQPFHLACVRAYKIGTDFNAPDTTDLSRWVCPHPHGCSGAR